jgi:hypothetical protein
MNLNSFNYYLFFNQLYSNDFEEIEKSYFFKFDFYLKSQILTEKQTQIPKL